MRCPRVLIAVLLLLSSISANAQTNYTFLGPAFLSLLTAELQKFADEPAAAESGPAVNISELIHGWSQDQQASSGLSQIIPDTLIPNRNICLQQQATTATTNLCLRCKLCSQAAMGQSWQGQHGAALDWKAAVTLPLVHLVRRVHVVVASQELV